MAQQQTHTWQRRIVSALAGAGYISLFVQWLILLALFIPKFFESSIGKQIFPQSELPPPPPQETGTISQAPQEFVVVLWMIFGVCMLGLVVYVVFVRYVSTVAKTTSQSVKVTSNKIVPVLSHQPIEKIPEKKRARLSRTISFWLLIILCSIPVGIALLIRLHVDALAGNLVVFVQSVLALAVLASVVARRMLIRTWGLKDDDIL